MRSILYVICIALIFTISSCRTSDESSEGQALTPPMGWNSWNCFQGDINETRIKEIAYMMEDAFGGRPLFDSGRMHVGDTPVKMDINVYGFDLILLEFTGEDMYGIWGAIRTTS